MSDRESRNPTCPTRLYGDDSNACASTEFVQAAIQGVGGQGGLDNIRLAKTANYTVQDADIYKTIALGGSAFFTLTFGAASGYIAVFQVRVVNEDADRAKLVVIPGLSTNVTLYPLQSITVFAQNNVWQVAPLYERWRITDDVTFYVRTDGSNSNDGLADSAGGAFLTIEAAAQTISKNVDFGNSNVIIQIGNGTYTPGIIDAQPFHSPGGLSVAGHMIFHGDSVAPSNVVLNYTGAVAPFFISVPGVIIDGLKVTSAGGAGIWAEAATVQLWNINFGACTAEHIRAENGAVVITRAAEAWDEGPGDGFTISAGAAYHMRAERGGLISMDSSEYTISGTPAFSGAFVSVSELSHADLQSATFTGSATGPGVYIDSSSSVRGIDNIPGDSDGTIQFGGHLDSLAYFPVAFADLPADPEIGTQAVVSNSNTTTWGATVAGSGSDQVLAQFNGTNWTVIGI